MRLFLRGRFLRGRWQVRQGTITFEWILLVTLVIIGIVGGLSAVRDSIVDELADIAEAALSVDQSWTMRFCTDCSTGDYVQVQWQDQIDGPVQRKR